MSEAKARRTKSVTLTLDSRSFSTYDLSAHEWIHRPEKYEILAGTSSRDPALHSSITTL